MPEFCYWLVKFSNVFVLLTARWYRKWLQRWVWTKLELIFSWVDRRDQLIHDEFEFDQTKKNDRTTTPPILSRMTTLMNRAFSCLKALSPSICCSTCLFYIVVLSCWLVANFTISLAISTQKSLDSTKLQSEWIQQETESWWKEDLIKVKSQEVSSTEFHKYSAHLDCLLWLSVCAECCFKFVA